MKSGTAVKLITFPGNSIDGATCIQEAAGERSLHYEEQNLGEYGICWVVETRNGIESARHNARFIESIVWAQPAPEGKP